MLGNDSVTWFAHTACIYYRQVELTGSLTTQESAARKSNLLSRQGAAEIAGAHRVDVLGSHENPETHNSGRSTTP